MGESSSSSSPAAAAPTVPGKIFVGGISPNTDDAALAEHFGRYGDVERAVVVRDRSTGKPRGFGFVTFAADSADAAISASDEREKDRHIISGKKVDVKLAIPKEYLNGESSRSFIDGHKAVPNENQTAELSRNSFSNGNVSNGKKIFVGGLPTAITDDEFRAYFEKFGPITDAVVLKDKEINRPRGFGFVTFETEESANEVLKSQFHEMTKDKKVEVKKAIPKIDGNMRRENNDNNNGVGVGSSNSNNINNGGKYNPGIRIFPPDEYTQPINRTAISFPVPFCDYTYPYTSYTPMGYGPMGYGPMGYGPIGYGPMGYGPINYGSWNCTNPNVTGYESQMYPGNIQNSGLYNNFVSSSVNLNFSGDTGYSSGGNSGGNSGVVVSANEGVSPNIEAVEAEAKAEVADKACGDNTERSKSQ